MRDLVDALKYLVYVIFLFLGIDTNTMFILMILICVDMITGVLKVPCIRRMRFSFKRLFRGLMGKFVLLIIPMTLALLGIGLNYNLGWIVNIVIKLMMISEVISIFNNFIAMKERKNIESKDYVYVLIKYLRKWAEKLFDNIFKRL